MNRQLFTYSTIKGDIEVECVASMQVSAVFQVWARQHGIDDEQSLAFLVCDKEWGMYFDDYDTVTYMADEVSARLDKLNISFPLNLTSFYNKINNI
jgi:hypothetical protein